MNEKSFVTGVADLRRKIRVSNSQKTEEVAVEAKKLIRKQMLIKAQQADAAESRYVPGSFLVLSTTDSRS